jgi:hypothetical protein
MDGTGVHHVKQSKSDSRQRSHVFPHMWELEPKDKCVQKYIYELMYIYITLYIYTHYINISIYLSIYLSIYI